MPKSEAERKRDEEKRRRRGYDATGAYYDELPYTQSYETSSDYSSGSDSGSSSSCGD